MAFRTKEEKEEWLNVLFQAVHEACLRKSSLRLVSDAGENDSKNLDSELGLKQPTMLRPDSVHKCMQCGGNFSVVKRKHHCRACGSVSYFILLLSPPVTVFFQH